MHDDTGHPARKTAFLETLAETVNVSAACRKAGIRRRTAYNWRNADPRFAREWDDALEDGIDAMEAELHRRAFEGVERPVWHKGEQVGTVRHYSDGLAMFLLKAHRPARYRDSYRPPEADRFPIADAAAVTAADVPDAAAAAMTATVTAPRGTGNGGIVGRTSILSGERTMTVTEPNASIADRRAAAVADMLARVREIERTRGVTREALNDMREELYGLAARKELFPKSDFPPPEGATPNIRYLLSEDADKRFALYMNSIRPGKLTDPHNHTTWAIVAAVEGEEINRFYERTDDGADPGKATLKQTAEVVVRPGVGVAMMPDDIHSIAVTGDAPTLHLHMYGKSLDAVADRLGFDLETGAVGRYGAGSGATA